MQQWKELFSTTILIRLVQFHTRQNLRYTIFPQQAKSELRSLATKLQQILPLTDNFTQFKQFLVRIKATKGLTEPCTVMSLVSLLIKLAPG